MFITDAEISSWVNHLLWPLFRLLGFFAIAPFFGARTVPMRIRLMLAMAISIMIGPMLPDMPVVESVSISAMIMVAQQIIVGFALGFVLLMVFQVFVQAGQAISMQMGLGFASMMDPANGVSVAVLSQWYLNLVTLIFIATNGHLVVLEVLVDSFDSIPVAATTLSIQSLYDLAHLGSWMFAAALVIALPAITALLLVNLSFGVMTRAAPQLNVFSLGFPFTMLMGLFIIWLSYTSAFTYLTQLLLDAVEQMRELR